MVPPDVTLDTSVDDTAPADSATDTRYADELSNFAIAGADAFVRHFPDVIDAVPRASLRAAFIEVYTACTLLYEESVVQRHMEAAAGHIAPATWQAECERAVFNAMALLQAAGRKTGATAILEVIRSAPRHPLDPHDVVPDCLFARCIQDSHLPGLASSQADADVLIDYFAVYLPSLPEYQRALLEASVSGVVIGWGMSG